MKNTDNSKNSYSQALKQIAITANSSLTLKKTLNSIARSVTKALKAAGCSILLLNPQKEHLEIIASYGLSDLYLRKGALNVRKSLPEIMQGEVTVITDVSQDKRAQYAEAAEMERISSILGAPLLHMHEIVGEIRIYTNEQRQFSTEDKDFLSTVANIVITTMEKITLNKTLKTTHEKAATKRQKLPVKNTPSSSLLRQPDFGHPSEEEFARLLDFYRVEWLYEPRSFPLAWQDNKITEMFTPDFYLPELDLYIELTTLKQSLITEKNRKIRNLKELYPDINIRLLNKKDYHRILAKYGYGPLGETKVKGISRVLLTHTQIQGQVRSLARHISQDYAGQHIVLIGILKGVVCFMSDLMQHISLPLTVEFMAISYFGSNNESAVKITKDIDTSIAGRDVLMVEDIVDTGMTLNYVLNHLRAHNPASLRVCTLLDKRVRRLVNVPLDYIGFEIPDEFIVGYGLDYQGEYRNLPFIGAFSPELIENEAKKQTK